MTNHLHLVLIPSRNAEDLSNFVKKVAGTYTKYVNARNDRTGTLWESRFRCSIIDTNSYLLACCRYIDLNPVRANIVAHPEDYEWSGYRELAGLRSESLVNKKKVYGLLDIDRSSPAEAYRNYVEQGVAEKELSLIRQAANRNQLTGDSDFVESVFRLTGRRVEHRSQGREKKASDTFAGGKGEKGV